MFFFKQVNTANKQELESQALILQQSSRLCYWTGFINIALNNESFPVSFQIS